MGGEKKKKQHTGRLDPIMAAVKTCWSLFFGAHWSRVGVEERGALEDKAQKDFSGITLFT